MKSVVEPKFPLPTYPFDDDTQVQGLPVPRSDTPRWMYRKVPKLISFRNFAGLPIWCRKPQALTYHPCAEGITRAGLVAALPPRLPEHLLDGPSGDEEESEAKGPCSTSTTPKSGKGMDPDECDHLMGITSVDFSSEEDGFGDGELTDTENPIGRVADDSATPAGSHSGSGNRPGADKDSRGYGSSSLAEVPNSLS